jgi:hypothetical protein
MTFQEAQARFTALVQSVTPALSAAELAQIQAQLYSLMCSVPNTPVFDPIVEAIKEVSPRLSGQITQAVLDGLAARSTALEAATGLLNKTAADAGADARVLQFAQPRLVAAALSNSVQTAQQLRDAIKAGNIAEVYSKAQALLVLLRQLESTIKEG